METLVIKKIEILDDQFKISLLDEGSGGEDFIAVINQVDLFDKLKSAYKKERINKKYRQRS
jgi:hypothetical protein